LPVSYLTKHYVDEESSYLEKLNHANSFNNAESEKSSSNGFGIYDFIRPSLLRQSCFKQMYIMSLPTVYIFFICVFFLFLFCFGSTDTIFLLASTHAIDSHNPHQAIYSDLARLPEDYIECDISLRTRSLTVRPKGEKRVERLFKI
jgi:hypothetical protein